MDSSVLMRSDCDDHYVAFLSNGTHHDVIQAKAPEKKGGLLRRSLFAKVVAVTLCLLIASVFFMTCTRLGAHHQDPSLLASDLLLPGRFMSGVPLSGHPFMKYIHEFEDFVQRFEKKYESLEEKARRFETYARNKVYIDLHNAQNLTYTLAVNAFADMTWDEFRLAHVTGFRSKPRVLSVPRDVDLSLTAADPETLPKSVDWASRGCVTPIKDQQKCGSCWAFSASGAVEGAYCVKHGVLKNLSEQQLVDCASAEGNEGCNGGEMDGAFRYMIEEKGLCLEDSYPYLAKVGKCYADRCQEQVKVVRFVDVPHKSESALMAAISQHGPVAVAIQADQLPFQFYHTGVFDASCGKDLNHAVLAVGYGTDEASGKDYWLIKNSWGARWGDHGYIKLARKTSPKAGECGVLLEPSYPLVD